MCIHMCVRVYMVRTETTAKTRSRTILITLRHDTIGNCSQIQPKLLQSWGESGEGGVERGKGTSFANLSLSTQTAVFSFTSISIWPSTALRFSLATRSSCSILSWACFVDRSFSCRMWSCRVRSTYPSHNEEKQNSIVRVYTYDRECAKISIV